MRPDTSNTEAAAAHFAAIAGASEHIGGGAEVNVPWRHGSSSPTWWCMRCDTPHWSGSPEEGCPDCGHHEEVTP
jgi:rubrerythrin